MFEKIVCFFKLSKSCFAGFFFLLQVIQMNAQNNPCDTTNKKGSTGFAADTTIVFENGTTITLNRCEFFDARNCISFKEIRTVEEVRAAGLTTMDDQGNVLLSCGMFAFDIDAGECEKKCLVQPAKIRIPLLKNECVTSPLPRSLYIADEKGNWKASAVASHVVKGANGKEYFEFDAACAGKYNCDRKMQTMKVKFKVKQAKELVSINFTSRCPLMNNIFYTVKHRKRIVLAQLPCTNPDSIFVEAIIVDKEGNYKTVKKSLSQLQTKYSKSLCPQLSNKVMRNILGVFKCRERNIYGKYIIE